MVESKRRTIGGSASMLLDSLRIVAALLVLIYHASYQWLTAYPSALAQLNNLSHAAVVVFFVLSGYLIAYTTTLNNRGPRQYAVARLSRLYSVMLPALLLTAVIEVIVRATDPALAAHYIRGSVVPRYVLSLLFCNESGLLSASPPINSPLWSLSFEFWYYTIFGIWFFRTSGWKSYALLAGACLIAGPKILILLPIWLMGFFAYRLPNPLQSVSRAWLLVFGLLLVAVATAIYVPEFPYALGYKPFFYANRFVTDWLIGVAMALALWCLPFASASVKSVWVKPIRIAADLSFPLYLLHHPLLILWRAVFGWRANDIPQMWLAIIGVTLAAGVVGLFLESQRPAWVNLFKWLINRVKPKPVALAQQVGP